MYLVQVPSCLQAWRVAEDILIWENRLDYNKAEYVMFSASCMHQ